MTIDVCGQYTFSEPKDAFDCIVFNLALARVSDDNEIFKNQFNVSCHHVLFIFWTAASVERIICLFFLLILCCELVLKKNGGIQLIHR